MNIPVQHECVVYGTLGFVLRLSQIYGVASLKFESVPNGWRISVSRVTNLYSKVLITITAIIGVSNLRWQFAFDASLFQRDRHADSMVPIISVGVILAELFAEAYCGMSRIQTVVSCLAYLQKIKLELTEYGPSTSFKTLQIIIAVWYTVGTHIVISMDFAAKFYRLVNVNSELTMATLFLAFYVAVIMQKILYLQFFVINITVMSSFKHLNNCLDNLLQQICKRSPTKDTSSTDSETLQRLGGLYCGLRDVVNELNDSHGLLMVPILIAILLHLVTTFYYFCSRIFGNNVEFYSTLSQSWWALYHVIDMFIIVEPCHQISHQVNHTKYLISRLMYVTPKRHDAFNKALKIFYYFLAKNDAVYAPMAIFQLNRGFIVTILATITKYLVIALQL